MSITGSHLIGFAVCACVASLSPSAWADETKAMSMQGGSTVSPNASASDKKLIASAMSAAPASLASRATIVVMESDGKLRTLRKGTNQFTCMPDDPTTPGPDPMCADNNGWDWWMALLTHKPPTRGKVGFIYMLAGASDASNTDPYATKPAPGAQWVVTGPHVMVVNADASYYAQYPKSGNPDTSVPYVMYGGTPYQHAMVPVK